MPRTRAGSRTDGNHSLIVDTFRAHGCSVKSTAMVGDGFVDIVVGYRGLNILVEIKDGSKPPSKRKLTDDEEQFFKEWQGFAVVVESSNDVDALINQINEELSQ